MVRVTENILEPFGKERGLFNYLWDQVIIFLLFIYVAFPSLSFFLHYWYFIYLLNQPAL